MPGSAAVKVNVGYIIIHSMVHNLIPFFVS